MNSIGHVPSYLPEVATYLDNIRAAGGSITMGSLMSIDRFVRDCKLGGFWDKFQEVMPIAGADLTSALIKLKYVTTAGMTAGGGLVAGDYTEATGVAGNGTTKFINSNFSASNLAVTGQMSAYLREQETATAAWMGVNDAASHAFRLGSTTGSNANSFWGGVANSAIMPANPTPGFYLSQRVSATDLQLYRNGVSQNTNATNTVPVAPALNIYLLARNDNAAVATTTAKKLSFFSIGAVLTATEIPLFYTAVQNLQTALGRNV